MAAMDKHTAYLRNSKLYETLLNAFTQVALERPKYLELWVALYLLGTSKTAKQVELPDGTVLFLQATSDENFKDILSSGSGTALQDRGWVLNELPAAPPGAAVSSRVAKANAQTKAEKFRSSSGADFLENSQLFATLLQALKAVTLERPTHHELWVALYLLGEARTAARVELPDGTVLRLKQVIEGNFKGILDRDSDETLRTQGWTTAQSFVGDNNLPASQNGLMKHSLLIFDCCVNETKAIRLEFKETTDGKQLNFQMKSVAPAILSFLANPEPVTIPETKHYQDLLQEARKGKGPPPKITKYFLQSNERVKNDYIINENDFIYWALEQKGKEEANKVVLGSTSWHRGASGADLERANKLIKRLDDNDVFCPRLTRKEQAVYEAASVAYAAHAGGAGKIHAVIDVDNNSVSYMYGMETMIELDCGWHLGKNAMKAEYNKVQDVEAALKVGDEYVNSDILTNRVEGRVGYELKKVMEQNRNILNNQGQIVKQHGQVVCLADMRYVDIGNGKGKFAGAVSAALCVDKFEQQINELEATAKKIPGLFFSSPDILTLVNLKLQIKLFKTFFHLDKTTLLFKRKWNLPGGVMFRAGWVTGWYMKYLQRLGIYFDGSKDVLQSLDQEKEIVSRSYEIQPRIQMKDNKYLSLIRNTNFITDAASTRAKLTEHRAIVFDCGFGETKSIWLTFEHGTIRFEEVGLAPAVLSFLGSPKPLTIAETKPFRDLQKAAKKENKEAPKITKYFLNNKDPVDKEYTIRVADFLRWVAEQQEMGEIKYSLVESSTWHQTGLDSPIEKQADELATTLLKKGLVCKKMDPKQESVFEAASVSYAAQALGVKKVDAVLSTSGGGVQYAHDMRTVIGLNCGWRAANNEMKNEYGKTKDIDAALKAACAYHKNVVESELKKATDLCCELGLTDNDGKIIKLSGTVICIGSCEYAARDVGIANKDDEVKAISMAECVDKFRDKVSELLKNAEETPLKFIESARSPITLVNLKIQIALFEAFFESDAQLIFKREWKLPGDVPFRTTWSSGWYLQHLLDLGVYFPGCEAVSKVLKQEAPLSEDSVLVLDCGAGETKALLLKYSNTGRNKIMSVEQIAEAPAVLSFLGSPKPFTIAETKPFHDMQKSAKKSGDPAPKITKYFLENNDSVDENYTINTDDFVQWVLEQRSRNKAKKVMIGTSGWHRVAGADLRVSDAADALVHRLKRLGIKCKMLNLAEESYFETLSVAYAASVSGLGKPDAVIGSGASNVQYMHGMKTVVGLDCGTRIGINAMKEVYSKPDDIEAALQAADDYVNGKKTSPDVTGRIGYEIEQVIANKKAEICDINENVVKQRGTVICIAGCYYAALAAGIANEEDEVTAISMVKCMETFKSKVTDLEAKARNKAAEFMAGRDVLTLVNLKLQIKVFETFFDSEAQLIFKRGWVLPGNTPFRTTWTAGYFLSKLHEEGVQLPGTKEVLQKLKDLKEAGKQILRKKSFNQLQVNANNLGMMLLSFDNAVEHIRKTARQIEKKVTPILDKVARKYNGHMAGLDFAIKGAESLNRKLYSKVVEMAKAHRGPGSFSPNLNKCIASIRDALRYTIVFPPKDYTMGVKGAEDAIMDGMDNERFAFQGIGKKFVAKNSWKNQDNETTYMGINAIITLKPVKTEGKRKIIPLSDNYPVELQFHTPGSLELKNEDSHLFYEALRDPEMTKGAIPPKRKGEEYPPGTKLLSGIDFKTSLYQGLKSMWNVHDDKGADKVSGQKYNGTEFKPFKPEDMSIVDYRGRHTRENLAKFERKRLNSGELYESIWVSQERLVSYYEQLLES